MIVVNDRRTARAAGRDVYRLGTPVVLWWVWVAFALANAIDLAAQHAGTRSQLRIDAAMAVITALVYLLALRPRVVADESGLTIVNPFRDHFVPWPAIRRVDATDWVRVHADGDGQRARVIECWALYVSASAKRREARGAPPRRLVPRGFAQALDQQQGMSRLPEQARLLAAMPPVKAIASRLDTRAGLERARAAPRQDDGTGAGQHDGRPAGARSRWARVPAAVLAAAVLAGVLALAGCSASAPAPHPSHPAARPVTLGICGGQPQAAPPVLVVICGTDDITARGLTWSGWGAPVATAHGYAVVDQCAYSDCAAADFVTVPIVLTARAITGCGHGTHGYSVLRYTFPRGSPFGAVTPAEAQAAGPGAPPLNQTVSLTC